MVCIYCGSDTKVTNSRPQKRANQVWRRRECLQCQAVFTTGEVAKYDDNWLVRSADDKFHNFSRDKLYISIHNCLSHRPDPVSDAAGITGTVIDKLSIHIENLGPGLALSSTSIRNVVQIALNRFDHAASVQYHALHT